MKQGIHQYLRVSFDLDLDKVERIEFRFAQCPRTSNTCRDVTYPSDAAKRVDGENAVDIDWTAADTAAFPASASIQMDTRIHLTGSDYNPETEIVSFVLRGTLFEREAGA